MTETSFSPAALDDLKGIASYVSHELGSPRAALDTIDRIVSKAEGLSTFPRRGAPLDSICPVHSDYRFVACEGWMLFYWVEGETPVVARILWGSSDYVRVLFAGAPQGSPDPGSD
jgi:plasmid stabilization system protein ParE